MLGRVYSEISVLFHFFIPLIFVPPSFLQRCYVGWLAFTCVQPRRVRELRSSGTTIKQWEMEVNREILLQQTISRILCAPQAAVAKLRPNDPNGDQHNNILFKLAFLLSLFHFLLYFPLLGSTPR